MIKSCLKHSYINNRIIYICKNQYKYFFKKRNVIGIALGYKIINGVATLEKCIKVFVSKKINYSNICNSDLIPSSYNGIRTDVIESGVLRASSLTGRIRPVLGGYSVGPSDVNTSGSVGCLVKDKVGIYILGNNHILADENRLELGSPIVQPSYVDEGKYATDRIAKLASYIPIRFESSKGTPVNYIDGAIAKVDNQKIASPSIALIGKINGVNKNVKLNESIQKVGSTTEHTIGRTTAIHGTFKIDYSEYGDKKIALFKELIITSKISDDGDSGCPALDMNKNVIGILAATADSISAFNPIDKALDGFRVSIVK